MRQQKLDDRERLGDDGDIKTLPVLACLTAGFEERAIAAPQDSHSLQRNGPHPRLPTLPCRVACVAERGS